MKFFNKGQAALEFLTTYGWAFLVILVMIGGLSYFGVFDFKSKLPDSCTFSGTNIECQSFQLNNGTDSQVQIRIKNIGEDDMYVVGIDVLERSKTNDGGTFCKFTAQTNPTTVVPRQEADLIFDLDAGQDIGTECGFYAGEKGTYDTVIRYTTDSGSSIQSTVTGTITSTVLS